MTPREIALLLLPNRRLLILQRMARAADHAGRIDRQAAEQERRCFPDHFAALVADGWIEADADGVGHRLGDDPDDPLGVPRALPPYPPKGAQECAPRPSPSPTPAPR